jgi:uncharacterized protein DUF4265
MNETDGPTIKVLFRVVGEDGVVNVETLWAFDLGEDRYQLDNTPFYAYSVSAGDIVFAPIDPTEGRPTFASVLEKSGNRTVRVIFDEPVEAGTASDALLQGILAMGCEFEGATQCTASRRGCHSSPVRFGLARQAYRLAWRGNLGASRGPPRVRRVH